MRFCVNVSIGREPRLAAARAARQPRTTVAREGRAGTGIQTSQRFANRIFLESDEAGERRVPLLLEILVAPEDDAAMGTSIDHIREFEPVEDGAVPDPFAPMPELAG